MSLADMAEIKDVLKPVARWGYNKKYWLLTAIRNHLITREAAMALHSISAEELDGWQAMLTANGARGLKTTKLQEFSR